MDKKAHIPFLCPDQRGFGKTARWDRKLFQSLDLDQQSPSVRNDPTAVQDIVLGHHTKICNIDQHISHDDEGHGDKTRAFDGADGITDF